MCQHPHTSAFLLTLVWLFVLVLFGFFFQVCPEQHVIKIIFRCPAVMLMSHPCTSHYLSRLEIRDLLWPHHEQQQQRVEQHFAFVEIYHWTKQPGVWSWGLGIVPQTSVATLIIPAHLLLWVTEVQPSTNATACRGCCFLCRLYPFITGDSRVVLSLLMSVWLLMGCAEPSFFLSSARLCLSWDNRHDLAN